MTEGCVVCDFIGPDLPWESTPRDIHRAAHELGRVLGDAVAPLVERVDRALVLAGRALGGERERTGRG